MGQNPIDVNVSMGNSQDQRHPRLPNPTSTLPWWRTQPHLLDEYRSSDSAPQVVDIAIIGAGMAGACTAYHLLSGTKGQSPSVAIFEARQACSGATGRNGGHARVSPVFLTQFAAERGPDAALDMAVYLKELLREMKTCAESILIPDQNHDSQRALAEECEMLATRSWDVFLDETHAKEVEKAWQLAAEGMREVAKQQGREHDVEWLGDVQFLKSPYVENVSLHH